MEAHLSAIYHSYTILPELHREDRLRPHAVSNGSGKGFLGRLVQLRGEAMNKLEILWHNLLFGVCCVVALVFGALISGAADAIAEKAAIHAKAEVLMELPISVLQELPVRKGDI